MDILAGLNEQQIKGVLECDGPVLIIAGAGSGKTKVLTHKIAYLIKEKQVLPWNILAITFTNKAANELKTRLENILEENVRDVWVGTFHSICVRILRREIDRIGYSKDFVIYDTVDQNSVLKKVLKEMGDEGKKNEKRILYEISKSKSLGITPDTYMIKAQVPDEKIHNIYVEYEKFLKRNNALDFDDILLKTVEIFETFPEVLEKYSEKFKYILVDEYQDTNAIQFRLIKMLAKKHGNITVVGDNDQGIYSFRGADIQIILDFEKDFKDAKIIKLEQNYRSTNKILDIANTIIKNNETKYEKKLWTDKVGGEDVEILELPDGYSEARTVAKYINEYVENGGKYSDIALLYRKNSLSRLFEAEFKKNDIPFKILGGLAFYERKEIKDVLAYLRLILNPSDDLSLLRIINEPKRQMGKTSIEKITKISESLNIPIFDVLKSASIYGLDKIYANTHAFVDLIDELRYKMDKVKVSELTKELLEKSGYLKMLEEDEEDKFRKDNIEEFVSSIIEMEKNYIFEENSNLENTVEKSKEVEDLEEGEIRSLTLSKYLENMALVSSVDEAENTDGEILLMTLHTAKGLEFKYVFLVGLEEDILPSSQSKVEMNLEEERRLMYVGITRAKEKLVITYAKLRKEYDRTKLSEVSRFVEEIPEGLAKRVLPEDFKSSKFSKYYDYSINVGFGGFPSSGNSYKNSHKISQKEILKNAKAKADDFINSILIRKKEENTNAYEVNTLVKSQKYGIGKIISIEPEGNDKILEIDFENGGKRKFMANFAKLEIIKEGE